MKCDACGYENVKGSFCPACGARQEVRQEMMQETAEAAPAAESAPVGAVPPPAAAPVAGEGGQPQYMNPPPMQGQPPYTAPAPAPAQIPPQPPVQQGYAPMPQAPVMPEHAGKISTRGYGIGYVIFFKVLYILLSVVVAVVMFVVGYNTHEMWMCVAAIPAGALLYVMLAYNVVLLENSARTGQNTERTYKLLEQLLEETRKKEK